MKEFLTERVLKKSLFLFLISSIAAPVFAQTATTLEYSFNDSMTPEQIAKVRDQAGKFIQSLQSHPVNKSNDNPSDLPSALRAVIYFSLASMPQQNISTLMQRKKYWTYISARINQASLKLMGPVFEDFPVVKMIAKISPSLPTQQSYLLQTFDLVPKKLLAVSAQKFWLYCSTKKNWLSAVEYEECVRDYFNLSLSNVSLQEPAFRDELYNHLIASGIDFNDGNFVESILKSIRLNKSFKEDQQKFLEAYYQSLFDLTHGAAEKASNQILSLLRENQNDEFLTKNLKIVYGNILLQLKNYATLKNHFVSESDKKGYTYLRLQNVYIKSLVIEGKFEEAFIELQKVPPYPELPSFYYTFFNQLNQCLIGSFVPKVADGKKCREEMTKFHNEYSTFNISNSDIPPFFEVWNLMLQKKLNPQRPEFQDALKLARSLPRILSTKVLLEKMASGK